MDRKTKLAKLERKQAEKALAGGWIVPKREGHWDVYDRNLPVEKHLKAIGRRLVDSAAMALVIMSDRGELDMSKPINAKLREVVQMFDDGDHAAFALALSRSADSPYARLNHLNRAIGIYVRDPAAWQNGRLSPEVRGHVEKLVAEANSVMRPKRARRRGR